MEAPEVPLENTHEHIKEHAEHSSEKWVMGVALSTAILAAIAAVASLLAGGHINEGMISQIKASDQWTYYQAKGIKAGVLETRLALLEASGKTVSAADKAKVEHYAEEQKEISTEATNLETESRQHLHRHENLASAVTMFQIAIAVSAISVLTKKRLFWFVGLFFGLAGLFSLALALR